MKQSILFVVLFFCVFVRGQQQNKVDFTTAEVKLSINLSLKSISGDVVYHFTALEKINTFFLDAVNMEFSEVLLNNKSVKYTVNNEKITFRKKLRKGTKNTISFNYKANPKQTLYFIDELEKASSRQIWTQGQGKYTSHWLPSFDDMNEKVEFDLTISFDKDYKVISNGRLTNQQITDSTATWHFDMEKPMSSYLLALAIGDYHVKELVSNSGIPIELYYYPQDSLKVEPTYRYTKEIFDFLETEIGVPYPWKRYKQIPVKDFLYAGMENTTATIFSDAYVVDSIEFQDKNYVNINAHELAHQWFGNLVTEVDSKHHWLHEGFATYYAYLSEQKLYGDNYFYWKLFDTAMQLNKQSAKQQGESLLNPKASSLTFYEKGAWALHALKNEVGETAFKEGVTTYLQKYKFGNVTVDNFIDVIASVSKKDLVGYKKKWLQDSIFPLNEVKMLLKKQLSIANFYKMQHDISTSKQNKGDIIDAYWAESTSNEQKKHIIQYYSKQLSATLRQSIWASNNLDLRQALLFATEKVTAPNEPYISSLLRDKSYGTVENALYKLWIYMPQHRKRYLEATKGFVGFKEKNVRQLWLTLSILTKGYEESNKQKYLEELRSYTSPKYYFETRRLAFSYLKDLFNFDDRNLKDLLKATNHPSWQFKKFARNLVEEFLKKDEYLERIKAISKELNSDEIRYIQTKIKQ